MYQRNKDESELGCGGESKKTHSAKGGHGKNEPHHHLKKRVSVKEMDKIVDEVMAFQSEDKEMIHKGCVFYQDLSLFNMIELGLKDE